MQLFFCAFQVNGKRERRIKQEEENRSKGRRGKESTEHNEHRRERKQLKGISRNYVERSYPSFLSVFESRSQSRWSWRSHANFWTITVATHVLCWCMLRQKRRGEKSKVAQRIDWNKSAWDKKIERQKSGCFFSQTTNFLEWNDSVREETWNLRCYFFFICWLLFVFLFVRMKFDDRNSRTSYVDFLMTIRRFFPLLFFILYVILLCTSLLSTWQ